MFKIGSKIIDTSSPTYIIAEVGVNHNGDVVLAKKLIDVAADSGADAVKFQTFKSEKLVSKNAVKAEYQVENTQSQESQLEMLKKLELRYEDFRELKEYCEGKGIEFLSTPFDDESAAFLNEIGVHAYKIGSGDLTNLPFLKKLSQYNVPILLSTGMANLGEIEDALDVLKENDVCILHCTSNYPAPYHEVNLNAIRTIQNAFGRIVGYSDHTEGNTISYAAVALGSKVVEKHFTLDRGLPGPDHKASIIPQELKELVDGIRNIEASMGDGIKRCMPSEINTKEVARKSIVAAKDLVEGEEISENDLVIKRPGTGIEPKYLHMLIGKKIKRNISADQTLTWEDLI